jgi:ankyrin repeat protein
MARFHMTRWLLLQVIFAQNYLGVRPTGAIVKGARVGSLDIVRLLLDSGVDPNEAVGKESPLVGAISSEHTAMFNLLLEHGATLDRETVKHCVREAKAHGLESMLRLLEELILLQARAKKPKMLEQMGVDIGA